MRVATLIKKLVQLNGNLPVVVDGYEGGVDDVKKVKNIKMWRNVNDAWYYGKHEEVASYRTHEGKQVPAVHLGA